MTQARADVEVPSSTEVVDAVVAASRVLVGVAARSIAAITTDVTLPQYRTLVILVSRGSQRIADIAMLLDVEPSTATRMSDRLIRKNLISKEIGVDDRRVAWLSATEAGRELVALVTRKRRTEIRGILRRMPGDSVEPLVAALQAFALAAGEPIDSGPALGWLP